MSSETTRKPVVVRMDPIVILWGKEYEKEFGALIDSLIIFTYSILKYEFFKNPSWAWSQSIFTYLTPKYVWRKHVSVYFFTGHDPLLCGEQLKFKDLFKSFFCFVLFWFKIKLEFELSLSNLPIQTHPNTVFLLDCLPPNEI